MAESLPERPASKSATRFVSFIGRPATFVCSAEYMSLKPCKKSAPIGGFDAERDIAGLTINRWPHGYAYEYNELYDPPEWNLSNGPHIAGRAQIGRISIANSDASAYAYANGAIDAADRAVDEQLGVI